MSERTVREHASPGVASHVLAAELDALLGIPTFPDYPGALNGLQVANRQPVTRVAVAVDASRRTIEGAIAAGAQLLIVHHGLFWSGAQRVVGPVYDRLRLLFEHDIALYSAHLPLDAHPEVGNNALLARALGLEPTGTWGSAKGVTIGVMGDGDWDTAALVQRARDFAAGHGHHTVHTPVAAGRRTRRWGIITGGAVSAETLAEAGALGIDTFISGEGPHWSAVDAAERDLVLVYAGHYATETLGVQALGAHLARTRALPWTFVAAPTGL